MIVRCSFYVFLMQPLIGLIYGLLYICERIMLATLHGLLRLVNSIGDFWWMEQGSSAFMYNKQGTKQVFGDDKWWVKFARIKNYIDHIQNARNRETGVDIDPSLALLLHDKSTKKSLQSYITPKSAPKCLLMFDLLQGIWMNWLNMNQCQLYDTKCGGRRRGHVDVDTATSLSSVREGLE